MNLAEHRKNLNRLADLIREEQTCLPEPTGTLERALEITEEKFLVVVIGSFSSGKSSMINALIGEELLPHGFLPETAVLGELHYGTKKRVTLYPKKGKWEGGDKPFTIEPTTEEIAKYVSLSDDDAINSMEESPNGGESDKRINAKFEKMIVEWPLDILKDGVVLVDSPGLNDPYSNDYIVEGYLPKADAIVYVMDSTKAYTANDKNYLETLNALGVKNIITAYTFYDLIRRRVHRDPQRLQQLRTRLVEYTKKYTKLGEASVHFLASFEGLDAKLDSDPVKWRESGFEGFENYLAQYLVDSKGTEQVRCIVNVIVGEVEAAIETIDRLNTATTQEDFRQQLSEAERYLQEVREISERIAADYRERSARCLNEAKVMVHQFITQELPQRIDLEGFTSEISLPEGIARLLPGGATQARATIQAAVEECREEIMRRANLEFKKWCVCTLGCHLQTVTLDDSEISESINATLHTFRKFFYTKQTVPYPVFARLPIYFAHIIARLPFHDRENLIKEIKEHELNDFREFFSDSSFKGDVNVMIDRVLEDIEFCINAAGTEMEKALKSKVKKAEQTVQQIYDRKKIDSAVADRLHDIKKRVADIGAEYDIHDLFRRRI